MFQNLPRSNYQSYLEKYPFHEILKLDLQKYASTLYQTENLENNNFDLSKKINKNFKLSIDPSNLDPFEAELDDLIRLHYLVTSRKVRTILEFGVGHSTIVLDHAITINKLLYQEYVKKNLRSHNNFEVHSIDNSKSWIKQTRSKSKLENTTLHFSRCRMSTFNGHICTFYDKIPNICPDLIYLDAPDQHSVLGNVRGISTRASDRVPMSGDILGMEHFLLPGTLIIVDGRAANARFLKLNLQRNWHYQYISEFDQHFFELIEEPLGPINKAQLHFMQSK